MRRVLLNASHDRRLRRDGFVAFPFLDPDEAASLRASFGELRGWDGQGFHADLQVPDPDYRRQVEAALQPALEERVVSLFDGYRPFLYNFICKFPGDDSELYLHRDWMYVDEREGHRTYVAWIALEDIRGDNGRLRALRGSHEIDRRLRGTDLIAPWMEHQDLIRSRLRSLRVDAGDCVVFDNALVHCSYPNLTDTPRVVAAVGMRPATAPLVHFWRRDADTAEVFEVDEDFFYTSTPQALLQAPPERPSLGTVPDDQLDLTAAALADRLDHGPLARWDRTSRLVAGIPTGIAGAVQARAAARIPADGHPPPPSALTRLRQSPLVRPVPVSILVLSWANDRRPSTQDLRQLVAELNRRPDVAAELWFFHDNGVYPIGDDTRVLDEMTTWGPAEALERVGAGRVANQLRGLRRHAWLAERRPDVVIFDDGIGGWLLRRLDRDHVRVVRANDEPPEGAGAEVRSGLDRVDLTLVLPGRTALPGSRAFDAPDVRAWNAAERTDVDAARARARERLGIDPDVPVVVGFGRDGWLDGPELFVRGIWALERRCGRKVDAVWLAPGAAPEELDRLVDEAGRCGFGDRFHVRSDVHQEDLDLLLAGDVALLPYRAEGEAGTAASLLGAGLAIVSFPVWTFDHPALHLVPHLDLDAAAHALATALDGDRDERRAAAGAHLEGAEGWIDRFLAAIEDCRS